MKRVDHSVWSTRSSSFPIKYTVSYKYTVLQMYSRAIRAALTLVTSVLWKITACSNNVKNSILLYPRPVTLVDCHYMNGSLSLCLTGKLSIRNENIYMEEASLLRGELHTTVRIDQTGRLPFPGGTFAVVCGCLRKEHKQWSYWRVILPGKPSNSGASYLWIHSGASVCVPTTGNNTYF